MISADLTNAFLQFGRKPLWSRWRPEWAPFLDFLFLVPLADEEAYRRGEVDAESIARDCEFDLCRGCRSEGV